MDIFVVWQSFL